MEKRYIGDGTASKVKHSPTIENEVCKSLFPSLSGIMANLGYKEKALANPDQNKIKFYSDVGRALWSIKDRWGDFTDEEIQTITAPVSRLIKSFTGDYERDKQIVEANYDYFIELINANLNSK
ncbi:MAG: hypothetical protein E6Q32_03310 [Neisseriales bacterium]|jgi:hypothetical protein|nr:MAG: hypothetical protein E6Q32_03310 [Neisseriales bacterium]